MVTREPQLKRQVGLATAVAVIIGQVIGIGIFLVPAGMARAVGSPFWLLLIWLAIGFMTLCGALCYAELAARFPEAGGSYIYLREAYGNGVAFLYGWMVLLVLDPGLTAIFAVGLASYAGFLLPLSPAGSHALAIVTVLVIGLVTVLGTRVGTGFIRALTALKIGTLAFIIVFGFASGRGEIDNFRPFVTVPQDIFGALAGGIVGAFFAFAGWWEVTRMAGELRDPQRDIPRMLVLGVLALTIAYISTSAVFMYLVPLESAATDEAFAALAGEALFGPGGGAVFASIVIVSVVGTLFAYLTVSPRVYYAMAQDGLFFRSVGQPHARFGTPHRATMIQMVLASVLILTGTFDQILSYFFFVVVCFIALTVGGMFILRRRPFTGYRTPLYPLTPIVFLVLSVIVLFLVGMRNPVETLVGVGVVSLGIPVYRLFKLKKGSL
ncbi:MAG: amino acid permease [Gemmatimonadetes bacterium]|nr:amino acid permease [Gemmatimonadota bacterium]